MSFMETKKDDYLQKGKNIFIVGLLVLLISRAVGAYSLLPSTIDSVLFSILAIFGSIVLLADFFTRVLKKIVGHMISCYFYLSLSCVFLA